MSALWVAKGPIFLQAENLDFDQTVQTTDAQTYLNLCSKAHANLYCICWIPAPIMPGMWEYKNLS